MNINDIERAAAEKYKASFWKHVDKTGSGECWLWTGHTQDGIGLFSLPNGRRISAHRLSYILAGNELEDRTHLFHVCGHNQCVRPEHLTAKKPYHVPDKSRIGLPLVRQLAGSLGISRDNEPAIPAHLQEVRNEIIRGR